MDNPSSMTLQTDASPIPWVPAWFGEVALIAHTLTRLGLLSEISEHVRFVRKRFGRFEGVDFVVMLIGYAISGEPTRHPRMTSAWSHLHPRLWPCSDAAGYLIVPDFVVSLPRWTSLLWKHCVVCSSAMRSLAWDQRRMWEGCGIERETDGVSLISMGPDRRHDSALCRHRS
jgi:hypothetical protein